MFSEWTASRAAGERLEDVIRRQWAVPSTHNPPTWERARLSEERTSANAIADITHPPHLGKQPPPASPPLGQIFCFFYDFGFSI